MIGQSYKYFYCDYGVPEQLTLDLETAQIGKNTLSVKTINKYGTRYHVSSPRRSNDYPAESAIFKINKRWYRIMLKKKVPNRL